MVPDTDAAVVRFCKLACSGQLAASNALLDTHPDWRHDNAHVAAILGDAVRLAALLERDAALSQRTLQGLDALLCAAYSHYGRAEPEGIVRCATLLLEHGANPHPQLPPTLGAGAPPCPLAGAAAGGNVALCRVLLEAGADPNRGEALFNAVAALHFDCAEVLLQHGGDPNAIDPDRLTPPLHHVLDDCFDRRAVEWLLAHGASPNIRANGETALHVATRRRREQILDLLVAHGAAIDAPDGGGITAYRHALRRGFDDVVGTLTPLGADTTRTPSDEVAVALLEGDIDRARALLASDPDLVRRSNAQEARLLPDLAGRDAVNAVVFLLDAGLDIAARGLDGGTALHQAAWFGQPAVARYLIDRGAPLEIRGDTHDSTPLGWVAHGSRYSGGATERSSNYTSIAEMLLQAGASIADPHDPIGDPHGGWLLADASDAVAEVLRRFGAQ